jgi:hypothetical protein
MTEIVESFRDVYGVVLDEASVAERWFASDPGLAATATATRWSSPNAFATRSNMARALILREYLNDVEALSDRLSSSRRQDRVSEEMLARLAHYERTIPGRSPGLGPRTTLQKVTAAFFPTCFTSCSKPRGRGNAAAYGSVVEFEA